MPTPKTRKYVDDELVPALSWVPDHLPKKGGKKIHRSSVARWLTTGVQGVRLRGWKAGRTWMTTPAAVREFTEALAERAAAGAPPAASDESKARRADDVAAELDAAGL
ncbi:DUF1580 domain-containing protein [Alienimonas sp. DA493]|uniref:DUF1580 domain-containing protein n=1 Tax=Alienimonas sp. DA493 TaxID=3373605 RepID=UPI0037540F0D